LAATGTPVASEPGCIATEIDAPATRQYDKSGKYPQMLVIFAIRAHCSAFDHESGSDRKALRQSA
jgi:hypothetical protein